MSLKFEQRRALLKARDFLRDCLNPKTRPKTAKELRERAYCALRHFPFLDERGEPMWSQDEFDDPALKERVAELDARGTTRKVQVSNPAALAFLPNSSSHV